MGVGVFAADAQLVHARSAHLVLRRFAVPHHDHQLHVLQGPGPRPRHGSAHQVEPHALALYAVGSRVRGRGEWAVS